MTEPLDGQVVKLSTRLSNHIAANIDAISHFAAQHPELGPEDRATFAHALHLAAVKLTALARWFTEGNSHEPP